MQPIPKGAGATALWAALQVLVPTQVAAVEPSLLVSLDVPRSVYLLLWTNWKQENQAQEGMIGPAAFASGRCTADLRPCIATV